MSKIKVGFADSGGKPQQKPQPPQTPSKPKGDPTVRKEHGVPNSPPPPPPPAKKNRLNG